MSCELAFELERKMLPFARWNEAPPDAYREAMAGHAEGVPTGISFDENLGWFVLQSSGQGPLIIWRESDL